MTFYTEPQRAMQDQFGSRPLADTLEFAIVRDSLEPDQQDFVASRDFFFLSTVTAAGEPTVSHKGGGVGLVSVVDEGTVAFPAYDGNGMFLSMGNIADTARIGMLFIDFETPNRLRIQATASFATDDELMDRYPGALGIVRASIDSVFVNCARYIHPHTRVSDSPYVPDESGAQPHPSWKQIDLLQDALPEQDRARTEETGAITQDEYAARLLAGES